MIVHLKGTLIAATPLSAVVDVQGVGYEVHTPVTTAEKLPAIGKDVFLYTLAIYREDQQNLYGFASIREREFFRLLIEKVSGIGPRSAISILSRLSVDMLQQAIANGDTALLTKCPGIGKKTAERLSLELKDKLKDMIFENAAPDTDGKPAAPVSAAGLLNETYNEAVEALIALGCKPLVAERAVRTAQDLLPGETSTSVIVKEALKHRN